MPPDGADFSSRWHDIKARFAARIDRGERLSARRIEKGERGIWQRRFWEHVIRDECDFERHVERGVCTVDWAAGDDVRAMAAE